MEATVLGERAAITSEITDLLRKHGITSTLQRVEIAQVLFSKLQHVSAEQVLEKVNRGRGIVSKATIYNTLRLFVEKGLIKEIIADPTKVFYEPISTDHHHFYDVDSGELIDIRSDAIKVDAIPQPPQGYSTLGVDVVVRVRAMR
ncbi:MAG: transcriptional repressor [Nitrospinae bacterium]|nr:transcriptional repressor [Nitrospinota bacterium]MBF0633073.1 transcriptional repressor [Nitrospinota bacterium]